MISKNKLTRELLKLSDLPLDLKTISKYHKLWWMNPRRQNKNSFRLTEAGFKHLKDNLNFQSYNIDFLYDIVYSSELILQLDRFLDSPYYLDKKSITVFREKTAVELILYEGDLKKYGWARSKSYKNNNQESN